MKTHCWDSATSIEDTMHALNDLVRAGKVHYIGVSNVLGWQLQKIVDTNKKFGYPQIVSLQASVLCVILESFINYVLITFTVCFIIISGTI